MANEAELKTRYQMALTYLGLDDVRNMKKAQTMIMELAAEEDYAPAQEKLAEWYEKGYMFPRDEEQAEFWHKKASGQATPEAKGPEEMFDLAYDIINNPGKRKNPDGEDYTIEEGLNMLEALAKDNYALAQDFLGDCYLQGLGVSENEQEAVKWYKKSAENGFDWGQYDLTMLC